MQGRGPRKDRDFSRLGVAGLLPPAVDGQGRRLGDERGARDADRERCIRRGAVVASLLHRCCALTTSNTLITARKNPNKEGRLSISRRQASSFPQRQFKFIQVQSWCGH